MNIRPDDRIPISVGFFREQSFSAQTGPLETTDASGPLWPYYTAISRIPWRMLMLESLNRREILNAVSSRAFGSI